MCCFNGGLSEPYDSFWGERAQGISIKCVARVALRSAQLVSCIMDCYRANRG